mmetsp:Transcript_4763/g.11256  ORF Transcript_4763/g.11256 Transcript_4763/m.11256 type:complete len:220 (-) Transcript_4763:179-838(-)|eukprot:CAMPEP_0114518378 /NCGR_PEP_ID=MMETSP0109-20121206/18412_1 /TAXON_ID=29199 /ORGANISM="Chlorarachnion reptans, Strain CCCM449" /LENGTH=219 /DNA_ID=CAMNT_0001698995 /DNA_START=41 /DNA_END=700 /DNA_ORIENTATION=+
MTAEQTPKEINELIRTRLYDPALIKTLEDYTQRQLSKNFYDFAANRHLLKLYKFYPGSANADIAGNVLIKSLMHLPASDYISCLYLLPIDLHSTDPIRTVMKLANLLENFEIRNFWKEAEEQKTIVGLLDIPGFCEAIEKFVVTLVEATCCDISRSSLEGLFRHGKKDVERLMKSRGWTVGDGGQKIILSKKMTAKAYEITGSQKISLQQAGKVLPYLQ